MIYTINIYFNIDRSKGIGMSESRRERVYVRVNDREGGRSGRVKERHHAHATVRQSFYVHCTHYTHSVR